MKELETHILNVLNKFGCFSYSVVDLFDKYLNSKIIEAGKHTPLKFREFLRNNRLDFVFNGEKVIIYKNK